jgi:hypothetical protein
MEPTQRHIWNHLLNPNVTIVVIGCIAIVVGAWMLLGNKGGGSNPLSPSSGSEGTQVAMSVPKNVTVPDGAQLVFTDTGEHGYIAKQSGGGNYITYDPTVGLTYKAPATLEAKGDTYQSFSSVAPEGMCGLVIKSAQEPNPAPKKLTVIIVGPDGKQVPGTNIGTFELTCDTFTLNIKTVASADPVLPDGVSQSVITATLTVTGPAQFINATRIKPGEQKPILTTPLGLIPVEFTTDLGVLAPPSPAKVTTDLAGKASVTITSVDAGIASVRAIALAVGDAKQQIHFVPKIVAVKMDFVPPTSPTNYEIKTIPANAKDLTIDWRFIPAAGNSCGHMTGAASGMSLTKNGFYHGPADNLPNGCPEDWEHASHIEVTVTDNDGQSDTKTFSARDFEGQGFVNLK